jgi:hypothetical protein
MYEVTVFARNKPTRETLKVRFNAQLQRWECSWHIERQEKIGHVNPKTQMAEGEVMRVLEDAPWSTNREALVDPDKTTVIH